MPPVTVNRPMYPLHELTTYELRDYRRQLESGVKDAPDAADLRQQLAEVLAEQEDRRQIHARVPDGAR